MKRVRVGFPAALAILIFLVVAAPASASYDLVGSGSAVLTLDQSFTKMLKQNGIVLSGRKSAKVKGNKVTLQAAGGKADPTIKKAEIDLAGELFFAKEKSSINIRSIALKTKPTPIFAKVSGGQLKMAKASKVELKRDGFGNQLLASKLTLTEKVATRLNKKLHVEAFAEGQKLGTLKSSVQPQTVAILPGGVVTMALDPAMVNKLTALSVSINPISPVERQGALFTLPIDLGGALSPDGKGGTLRTAGSMELLRLGAGQLFWKEAWLDLGAAAATTEVDLEPAPPYPGKLGRVPFVDLKIPAGGFVTDPAARTMTVTGAAVTLQATTAALFNQGFAAGKDEFHAGELVGTASFVAQAQ